MRTTVKLRVREPDEAEEFMERLREFLDAQDVNVSISINNSRWQHFGRQTQKFQAEQVLPH